MKTTLGNLAAIAVLLLVSRSSADPPPAVPPLLPNETPPSDTPNYFDPSAMDSGGIFTAVSSCTESAHASAPNLSDAQIGGYCVCTVDAMRRNFAATRDLARSTPTLGQVQTCGAWVKSGGPKPYAFPSPKSTAEIWRKQMDCMSAGGSTISCGCMADFELSAPPNAPIAPMARCQVVAKYWEATKKHLTVRQFQALR
jgi:hypothetical protein